MSLGVLDRESCSFKPQGGVLRVSRGSLLYMKELKRQTLCTAWKSSCWRSCGNY